MPEEYNKIAEGIVKGTVPMVAGFVERYITEEEPGFFVGERERVDGDIRIHVTVFGYLDQSDPRLPDSTQLGVVDLQQLPEERAWMVVGVLPSVLEHETWLNDLYSAMVRRMAQRLVQFGFLDAPNRPRLRAASTWALTQVAQAVKPPRQVGEPRVRLTPELAAEPAKPAAPAASQPAAPSQPPPQNVEMTTAPPPAAQTSTPSGAPSIAAQPVSAQSVPSSAALATAPSSPINLSNVVSGPQLDIVLTIAMVFIWLVACGMLSYLLFLLLR